jgi:hypothetical protein
MDVYEHIAVQDRASLHEALAELQTDGGRIVLAFPTPRHQAWLRQYHPHTIQPVDEDINIEILLALAHDTRAELLLYQEVNVWYEGDYAHAVLGNRKQWRAVDKTVLLDDGIRKRIRNLLFGRPERLVPERSERLALVQKRLGGNFIK